MGQESQQRSSAHLKRLAPSSQQASSTLILTTNSMNSKNQSLSNSEATICQLFMALRPRVEDKILYQGHFIMTGSSEGNTENKIKKMLTELGRGQEN